jgi:hypothetical protein
MTLVDMVSSKAEKLIDNSNLSEFPEFLKVNEKKIKK